MKFKAIIPILFSICINAYSQSTSNWIPLKSSQDSLFKTKKVVKNSKYINLKLEAARINNQSNLWTRIVSKDKQAYITVDISVSYPNRNLEDKRNSKPIKIRKQNDPVDFGWSQMLAKDLPTSFSSLKLNIGICSSAKDGVEDMVNIASEMSSKNPVLSGAQPYIGLLSGTKSILDLILSKELAKDYLQSNNELITTGYSNQNSGYYVIFGDENSLSYQKYLTPNGKLFWNSSNNTLTFNSIPVNDVNYFIIKLEVFDDIYPIKDFNLLTNVNEPWAKLYIEALSMVNTINSNAEAQQIIPKIREKLISAKSLLDTDFSLVFTEKEAINSFLRTAINNKLKEQQALVMTIQSDFSTPNTDNRNPRWLNAHHQWDNMVNE